LPLQLGGAGQHLEGRLRAQSFQVFGEQHGFLPSIAFGRSYARRTRAWKDVAVCASRAGDDELLD
ncbi:MAG: hypothetical protein J0I75_22600, partial [Hyphomicrobium sp.]|nr:hypothetical protein [Hyphomicrobium sp.]